jgi:hypothetical protein
MIGFPLSYLNGPELLTTSQSVLSILSGSSIQNDQVLQHCLTSLTADVSQLSRALSVQRSSAYTVKIEHCDQVFDSCFVTWRNHCQLAATQQSRPEVAAAASVIVTAIRSVDWYLNRKTLAQEIAGGKALTDLMTKVENVAALAACNVQDWYADFRNAYTDFVKVYSERIESDAVAAQDSPDVKNAKNDTRTHLEQLYNYCSVLDSVNKATYGDLTARLDEVVNSVVPSVRARKTRVSNNAKTAEAAVSTTTL